MSQEDVKTAVTFVVRAACDHAAGVRGSVTRVRTGDAASFAGIDDAARVLAEMLTHDFSNHDPARGPAEDAPGPTAPARTARESSAKPRKGGQDARSG